MSFTKQQLKQIIEEEFVNLINEEEIDEKLFDKLKSFGRGLLSKTKRAFSNMPDPQASSGVGKWYATYKEPQQKKPEKPEEEPQKTAQTAMVRASPTGISTDVVDMGYQSPSPEKGTATARLEPRKALPPGEKPQKSPDKISGELPPAENIPLQLPAPKRVGIVKNYGSLMYSAEGEDYNLLSTSCINTFKKSEYYNR
jgi:hypothetical protein